MTETSPRLALPLLQAGQAQKEIFHNEALARLDAVVHPVIEAIGLNDPPATPAPGQCWIVGSVPTGAWSGRGDALACFTSGGWRFIAPVPGLLAWSSPDSRWVWHDGNSWINGDFPVAGISIGGTSIIGPQQPSIASPTSGATVDEEARAALNAMLLALRAHGLIAS